MTHLVDYTRLGHNTFVQQISPQPQIAWSLVNGSGADPYTGLDQFDRVVDNRWYNTGTNIDLDRIQHGYDRANNRPWRKNTVADAAGVYLDELYSYDGIYRLKEMQRGQLNASNNGIVSGTLSFAQAWGLDATGNWGAFRENDSGSSWNLQQTRTANKANEIIAINAGGWAQPIYDAAGNMSQLPQSASPSAADEPTYDAWNRMISVSTGGSFIQNNAYDAENRRVTKLVSGTARHYYYSSNWQDLEERLGSSTTPTSQFAWGLRYIDDLVLRDRGIERFYTMQDGNWNVSGIITSSGEVSERYTYAPYGAPTFLSASLEVLASSAYSWETLFAGYRFDAETALTLSRSRFLTPRIGQWLSVDPIVYREWPERLRYGMHAETQDGDNFLDLVQLGNLGTTHNALDVRNMFWMRNAYAYVNDNPLNGTDPSGLWELRCRLLSGAAVATLQRHCWVECNGKSYSLLNDDGTATPAINDPADLGKGRIVDKGADECDCIAEQFEANKGTYPYDKDDCNSNYYASQLLKCCGITPHPKTPHNIGRPRGGRRPWWHKPGRPAAAYGWGRCKRKEGKFKCSC